MYKFNLTIANSMVSFLKSVELQQDCGLINSNFYPPMGCSYCVKVKNIYIDDVFLFFRSHRKLGCKLHNAVLFMFISCDLVKFVIRVGKLKRDENKKLLSHSQ